MDYQDARPELQVLWQVELDIYRKLREVCEKHQIQFFADYGTLLGAVRHQGFIPWDDDMDFTMMADQFETFCRIAPQEFRYPYFFQSFRTEKGFSPWHV